MLSGKSCCFVVYKEIESAINAFESINGKLNIAQDEKPLFLLYSETVPETVAESNFQFAKRPEGLILIEEFISANEETKLLSLNAFEQNTEQIMKHRIVKHYGYEFLYTINNVDRNTPLQNKIPDECNFLWHRLTEKCPNIKPFNPDQLTVNCYHPGHGIPLHVDTHSAFEDPIISLSLGSSTVMEFKNETGEHLSVVLPRRSLLILSGESRYKWTHGITPRVFDVVPTATGLTVQKRDVRVSFTFRKIKHDECKCMYATMCDSRQKNAKTQSSNNIDQHLAVKLEEAHVHDVYENVAGHFSETRSKKWPGVQQFLQSLEKGAMLVDVGCGNGKYLSERSDIYDVSIIIINTVDSS